MQKSKSANEIIVKGWTLKEDVAGKPGWISTNVNSVIEFPVSFGQGLFKRGAREQKLLENDTTIQQCV